jgi:hypothetical protein
MLFELGINLIMLCCYKRNVVWFHPSEFVPFVHSVYGELYGTGLFEEMSISTDEDEHSIEMQLPYIAKVMERLLHLLVASCSDSLNVC